MAAAVLELFPETKLGHGPATENGFFYDFYRPTAFTPEDLEKIERKCRNSSSKTCPTPANSCRARKVWKNSRPKATS
jgi:threonyl-tRNA synthetase